MNEGTADPNIRLGLGSARPLCSTCDELDLEDMLGGERNERSMGPLSDYSDPNCPFCSLISQSVCLAWGAGWDSARLCSETSITPKLFIQSRSPLSVKRRGHTEYPQPCLLVAMDQKPPSFHQNRAPLREIDRVKDRFIIAEIESLPDDSLVSKACFLPRREVRRRVNIQLVKKWLEECKKHRHSKKSMGGQQSNLFGPEHPFRLIDVMDECLVQKSDRCEYVALSYVWGRIPTILFRGDDPEVVPILLTTQDNVKDLSIPKALSPPQEASLMGAKIPRTVRDAMELTREIGLRYLWVDTLCIVQNDPEDKARLIGRMDEVYDMATLTIIAAAGSDADTGLRGISHRAGRLIEPVRIMGASDGMTINLLLRPPSLCEEVRGSTWNTRGWTFQEQCLSQRCLYFTAEETFFNCAEVQWREAYDYGEEKCEGLDIQVRTGPPWWSPKLRRDLDPTPYYYLGGANKQLDIQEYQKAVQDYGRKNLTFPQDVLNAFEGIFNRFKRAGDTSEQVSIRQTQGIPTHLLSQAILWFPSDDAQRRICNSSQSGETVDRFSTWSWASWIGPVDFVFADSLWLSRNISQAIIKHVPIYTLIPYWHYGDSSQPFWSHSIWKIARESRNVMTKHDSEQVSLAKSYLSDRIGIDSDRLLDQSSSVPPPGLRCGELGFFAPFLPASEFHISVTTGQRAGSLQVSKRHHGKFRFDGQVERVDELVGVVVADTITKPPDTQASFLGLVTRDGISSRVGIGYIYGCQEPSAPRPKWQHKFFKVQ